MDHGQWAQALHWMHMAVYALFLIGVGVVMNALNK